MSEPVIIVKSQGRVVGRCDESCYDGIAGKCCCCCGGVNHGVGYERALRRTQNIYNAVIELEYFLIYGPVEIIRPRPASGLFKRILK